MKRGTSSSPPELGTLRSAAAGAAPKSGEAAPGGANSRGVTVKTRSQRAIRARQNTSQNRIETEQGLQ